MRFINEQNSQELQISHSLRICFFTELRKVTVGAGFLLLLSNAVCANSTVGIRIPDDQTLPAAGLHIVGAVRLLLHSHRESAQSLPLHSNSWRSDASCAGLYIVCAGHLLLHSHTESAQSLPSVATPGSEFLAAARRFLPLGCTSWVPGACSCIHTQNQRNICRWHPNSWWPDASCQQHPATSWWPDASCSRTAHRGCCRLLLHSHTQSAQSLPLASDFLAARRWH